MRAHNNIPNKYNPLANVTNFANREPWLQSERIQKVIRASIAQRYSQMHYLYTAFYQANTQGLPIMRPVWMEFPTDNNTFASGN